MLSYLRTFSVSIYLHYIYTPLAWAHLILYGEEETKKAQKQGEEAVAAYEQEKKDIADGKIIAPPPKAAKKKKAVSTKEKPAASRAKADKKDKKGSDRSSNSKKATQAKEFMKPIVPKVNRNKVHVLLLTDLCICKRFDDRTIINTDFYVHTCIANY